MCRLTQNIMTPFDPKFEVLSGREPACNSTLAIGGVPSPLDSFEVTESSVLRINFCAEKPAHRQSAKRYAQFSDHSRVNNFLLDKN
jgi:hypothetical protein